jgi:hypothetical protein
LDVAQNYLRCLFVADDLGRYSTSSDVPEATYFNNVILVAGV